MDCLLGIDLGSSGVKAAVFGADGTCLGTGAAKIERLKDQPLGRDLHDARDWWRQSVLAGREALADISCDHDLRGIACCGFHHVPVFLDGSAEPAMPVVMMHDCELPASRERLREDGRLQALHEATRSFVSAAHFPSIAEESRRSFAREWQEVRHVLLAKDYLRYRLTGELGTEICDATGTNLIRFGGDEWSVELAQSLKIKPEWLPAISQSSDKAGELSSAAAGELGIEPGVPVYYGGGDSHCGLLGLGCIEAGSSAILLGTNCTLRTVFDRATYDPQTRLWAQRHVVGQRWTVSASSLAGASVLQWARRLLSDGYDSARAAGDRSSLACEDGLFFLPFIHGERCPVYAPEASAAFVGLRSHHTAADMFEASKEGIGFLLRMCWEIICELAEGHGQALAAPVISGGGSADLHWVGLIADTLGCELRHVEAGYAGCLGAAMLAGVGGGIFADASDAVAKVGLAGRTIEPSASANSQLSAGYENFKKILELHIRSGCAPGGG